MDQLAPDERRVPDGVDHLEGRVQPGGARLGDLDVHGAGDRVVVPRAQDDVLVDDDVARRDEPAVDRHRVDADRTDAELVRAGLLEVDVRADPHGHGVGPDVLEPSVPRRGRAGVEDLAARVEELDTGTGRARDRVAAPA
ncbi:hypothetical protein D3C74_361560 [compost metagenome]